ncbi:Asp23/Gls24 family envelope stress response protein [Amycolatopsis magusensis]|uniref:Asp23/Gls24 family envelope stress response protein n=1 Tax=Amycolatopsis magusensis TaxID=882444 RepID=UPI0024A7B4EF|nr:Asp23/Gls24 family envelope stress response protein [Amycolatopsis magusensis]MDI5975654.1 Asp23/Gls24 family envelope stress response protein [Amycolatopsis magusensis]
MSDVVNSIFGRTPSEYAASTNTPETRGTETIVDDKADLADSAPAAIVVVEPAAAESDSAADTDSAVETDTDEIDDTDTAETETETDAAEDVGTDEQVEDEDEAEEADEATAPEDITAEAEIATEEEEETVAAPVRPAAAVRGNTSVDDGVVTKVVTMVARRAEGVHELGEGISVGIEDDVALIDIPLVIEFGHAVKALAEQLRTDVIEAVEQFLGLEVEAVDVRVTDIHLPDAG